MTFQIIFTHLMAFVFGLFIGWFLDRRQLDKITIQLHMPEWEPADYLIFACALVLILITLASVFGGYQIDQQMYSVILSAIGGSAASKVLPNKKK